MAFTYENTPVLSKIKIGSDYYYLKDADLRSIVDSFNQTIVKGTVGNVSDNDNSFVTAANIKSYVDSAVAVGLVIEVVTALPEASASEMGKIYLLSHSHEGAQNNYDEYIVVRTGTKGSYIYNWEKIGNTDIDLSGYVSDVKVENKILKVQKGKGEYTNVYTFGDFATANSAEGKVTTVDSASFNYTPSGSINVTLKDSTTATNIESTGSFTPKGSITGSAISGGSINVTLKDATEDSEASIAKEAYTPEGSVSAPTITVKPTTKEVNVVSTNGTLPSFTAGTFKANVPTKIDVTKFNGGSMTNGSVTFPTLTGASIATKPTATFAKQGLIASVGSGEDAETLVLTDATTASAITDVTINGGSLNGGSYTAPVLTSASLGDGFYTEGTAASKTADSFNAGKLPTLASQNVMTSASATASAPTFIGTEVADLKVIGITYKKQVVDAKTFTPTAATLGFTGTVGDVNVTGSYNKQEIDKKEFTGTAASGSEVSLSKTEKTVTVNPK